MAEPKDNSSLERAQNDTSDSNHAAVEFAQLLGRLKTTPRTGWIRRGVPKWESVADHSWRVAALSLLLPGDYDLQKCIAMGVLHDVAESLTGDICPDDGVSQQEKARLEEKAVNKIASLLSRVKNGADIDFNASSAQQLLSLLHEYEKRESKEAIAVKDLDLLDMLIQAGEYEECYGLDLGEFYDGTPVSRFRTSELQNVAQAVHDQRESRMDAQSNSTEKNTTNNALSASDAAFVAEYSKASTLSSEELERVVMAMRKWDNKSTNTGNG
jgi:putative hydrolase of HD superfamily